MSDPQRIACFLPDLGGGGAERVMLASIKDLLARGHAVDLIVMNTGGALMPLLPPAVRVIDLRHPDSFATLRPLAAYLRRQQPDALHAQMWPMTVIAVVAHRIARSSARLLVSDQVALAPHMTSALQRRALKWSVRLLYPRADGG